MILQRPHPMLPYPRPQPGDVLRSGFFVVDRVTGSYDVPGASLAVKISRDGGAFEPVDGCVTEVGGEYQLEIPGERIGSTDWLAVYIDGGTRCLPVTMVFDFTDYPASAVSDFLSAHG